MLHVMHRASKVEYVSSTGKQLPRFTQIQCSGMIRTLQKSCREGNDIRFIIGYPDIKTTLSQWTKQEIDLLMKIENQYKDLDEDVKDEKISQALPRWIVKSAASRRFTCVGKLGFEESSRRQKPRDERGKKANAMEIAKVEGLAAAAAAALG